MIQYLKYPEKKDVIFVLGAGASHPDGIPLQRHILPSILSSEVNTIGNTEIGNIVIEFIKDNFHFNSPENYPQLEAVFGFLDYFLQQNESLSAKYSNAEIQKIKEYLIKLIYYVVNSQTSEESQYYKHFWKLVFEYSKNFSIITLNYDTLLEQAFEPLFKKVGLLDYCFRLMNYEKYPELKDFNFWINPRGPVEISDGEIPAPIKLMKLHGSLNWKYCNCCNQTLLTPWDQEISLDKGKFLGRTHPENIEYEYLCPLDGTDFHTLIMPPSFLKSLQHPVISQLMNEASREIRSSDKIVFIGYSLSNADLHIKALFKKSLKPHQKLYVVNKRLPEVLKSHYYSLTQNIEFIQATFEQFVTDTSYLKKILE